MISGTKNNEGIVITRNRNSIKDITSLTEQNWFLVHTNYDRDIPDPEYDFRRTPAEDILKRLGNKDLTEQVLFNKVHSKYPNLNKNTIFTTLMSASTGYLNTTLWY